MKKGRRDKGKRFLWARSRGLVKREEGAMKEVFDGILIEPGPGPTS